MEFLFQMHMNGWVFVGNSPKCRVEFIIDFFAKSSHLSQLATVHSPITQLAPFAYYAHSFSQMVANAKASGDEIAALQMRQMEMEFEMADS